MAPVDAAPRLFRRYPILPDGQATTHAKCVDSYILKEMAGVTGLEPAASGVTGQRSNQLSYTPKALGSKWLLTYAPP